MRKKIRIGIATFIDELNYGAILQAYALGKYIEKSGYDVCFISSAQDRSVHYKNAIKAFYYNLIVRRRVNSKKSQFVDFKKDFFRIQNSTTGIDILVCGSDQIWNTEITKGFNPLFWGEGAPISIAYAASCGDISMLGHDIELIKRRLLHFYSLSVRERDLCAFVEENTGLKCPVVCDPVLLLREEKYHELANQQNESSKYVLIYRMNKEKALGKLAETIAKERHIRVIEINNNLFSYSFQRHKTYYSCSIGKFLSLFENAEYIITNSFHGTAFAIIFRKPFYVMKSDKRNSRIVNLCNIVGLGNRVLNANCSFSVDYSGIDYSIVLRKLKPFTDESKYYLDEMLRKASEDIYVNKNSKTK